MAFRPKNPNIVSPSPGASLKKSHRNNQGKENRAPVSPRFAEGFARETRSADLSDTLPSPPAPARKSSAERVFNDDYEYLTSKFKPVTEEDYHAAMQKVRQKYFGTKKDKDSKPPANQEPSKKPFDIFEDSLFKLEPLEKTKSPETAVSLKPSPLQVAAMRSSGFDIHEQVLENHKQLELNYQELLGIGNYDYDYHNYVTLDDYLKKFNELSHAKNSKSADDAVNLLQQMRNDYLNNLSPVKPNGACYNLVIHALALAKKPYEAEKLLFEMWEDFYTDNQDSPPDMRVYTSVLLAWLKSGLQNAPWRCEILLDQMHDLYDRGHSGCKPDLFAYTTCLHCWAESKLEDASQHAHNLYCRLKSRVANGDESLRPDRLVYSNLMNAFSHSKKDYAKTETIFWEMTDDFIRGNEKAKPTIRNFNTALSVWSRNNCNDSPERAEAMIERLRRYNNEYGLGILPDAYTYSLVLKTWAHCKRSDGGLQTELAFLRMKKLYEYGCEAAKPDLIKCTTTLTALSRADMPERAQSLLLKIIDDYKRGRTYCMPDRKCFNVVMGAWTRSSRSDSAEQCERLIKFMWNIGSQGMVQVRPDAWSYKTLIFCWSKRQCPEKADAALRAMETLHRQGRIAEGPDEAVVEAVIRAWSSSKHPMRNNHIQTLKKLMNYPAKK